MRGNRLQAVLMVSVLAVLCAGAVDTWAQPGLSVSLRADFGDLDEYGEWYKLPKVGWVWSPYADEEWRPFTYGHWSWTSDGWMWVSYEQFGWIVCHYGNWYYDDDYGWLWVPGYDWSPARVTWYVTDWDICWAPMPPPGRVVPKVYTPAGNRYWFVAPGRFFTSQNIHQHRVLNPRPRPGAPRILKKSAPDLRQVKRLTGRPVGIVRVQKSAYVSKGGKQKLMKPSIAGPAHKRDAVPVGVKYRRPGPHGPGPAAERNDDRGPGQGKVGKPAPAGGKVGTKAQDDRTPSPKQKAAPGPMGGVKKKSATKGPQKAKEDDSRDDDSTKPAEKQKMKPLK